MHGRSHGLKAFINLARHELGRTMVIIPQFRFKMPIKAIGRL